MSSTKLRNEFSSPILDYNNNLIDIFTAATYCLEKSKKIACEFALWKETIMQDENGMYFSESRAQISRNNPVNMNGLFDVFINQKSLKFYIIMSGGSELERFKNKEKAEEVCDWYKEKGFPYAKVFETDG